MRLGTVDHIDPSTMTAYVKIKDNQLGPPTVVTAQMPMSFLSSGGVSTGSSARTSFIGGWVEPGTPVIIAQAESSGAYYIVNFLARDPIAQNTVGASKIKIPVLEPGTVTIQANVNGGISLNDDGIYVGEPNNLVTYDTTRKVLLNTFSSKYTLTQGSREVTGVVKRDVRPSINFPDFLRAADPRYDDTLKIIGMDPVAQTDVSNYGDDIRNPARVEKREVVYEYEQAAQVLSNDLEIKNYNPDSTPDNQSIVTIDRRAGRNDILSLSLVSPNYLMESVKGTVVDIFGNIVDLNRSIIPIGDINTSDPTKKSVYSAAKIKSTLNESNIFQNAYQQIKRAERKSIAVHFEMNARNEQSVAGPPNVDDTSDYARARSRFFLDVDKEGQIKLNVPASSEFGNVSLLTRYENYSTVNPNQKSNDPNDLVFNQNNVDIVLDSFINNQVIELVDDVGNNAAPKDRVTNTYIMHGSVYHNISQTCKSFLGTSPPSPASFEYTATTSLSGTSSGQVPPPGIPNIVNPKIIVAGPQANAGGRSASLNLDGSVEINIGANTVDRQSIWLDTEGGMIANFGRDLNGVSFGASMDGQFLLELGGRPTPTDSRFSGTQTTALPGAFDIRVYNQYGELAILRIDNSGIQLTTPSRIVMYANDDMLFRCSGTMTLDAEQIVVHNRKINKSGNDI